MDTRSNSRANTCYHSVESVIHFHNVDEVLCRNLPDPEVFIRYKAKIISMIFSMISSNFLNSFWILFKKCSSFKFLPYQLDGGVVDHRGRNG